MPEPISKPMVRFNITVLERAYVVGLYALLVVPLVYAQSFIFPFVTVKVAVFETLLGIVGACWLVLVLCGRLPKPHITPITRAFGILLIVLIIAAAQGVDVSRSIWSTQERALGLFALAHFFLLFLMMTSSKRLITWDRYFMVSLTVSTVACIFAFVQRADPALFFERPGSVDRPGSFLGNPTFLAAYLLPHLFLAMFYAVRRARANQIGWSAVYGGAALLHIVVIFMTQTRGALLGLVAGFIFMAFFAALRGGTSIRLLRFSLRSVAFAALGAMLALAGVFFFTRAAPFWQHVPGLSRFATLTLDAPNIQPRLIALKIGWDAIQEHPWLGYGFENFKYPFDERYDPKLLRYGFGETYFDKPHNIFIEYAISGGLLGLGAYLGLFVVLCVELVRAKRLSPFVPFGLGIVVSYLVQNAFVFDTFGGLLITTLVMAFVDAEARPDVTTGTEPTTPKTQRTPYVAVAAVVLAAALLVVLEGSIMYANNRQYWVLNYFLNRQPERAIEARENGLGVFVNPYADALRKDFASAVAQMHLQGVFIPNIEHVASSAMDDLRRAVENNPHDYFLRTSFADFATTFSAFRPEYLHEAIQLLDEAEQLSPNRQQIRYVLAKVKIVERKIDEAFAAMREAVELDPQVGDAHFYFGLIAFEAGKSDIGFSEIETAERLGRVPRNAAEARLLANQYGDAGNYARAIELYTAALTEEPNDLESTLKLGLVYYSVGDIDAARLWIGKVAEQIDLRRVPAYPLLKPILDHIGLGLE